jgi:hypothetical protein
MAIKHTIAKLEDVDEAFRSHYKPADPADVSKGFVLDLEGAPAPEDTGALKRALERVRAEKDEALAQLKAKGTSTEEMEALRKSADEQIKTLKEQIKTSENKAREAFLEKQVTDLATQLAGTRAAVLAPHIRNRLVIEAPDGTNIVRVLGKDGKASALSVEDLVKEIKADELFAPVIQAGRASGSGASGAGSSAGGAGGGAGKPELPKNATPAQKVEWLAKQNTPGFTPE